jgi:cold shock protein
MTGTIKNVNHEKGYGFIIDSNGIEHFFHRSGLEAREQFASLRHGLRVQFTSVDAPKGPRAEGITVEEGE